MNQTGAEEVQMLRMRSVCRLGCLAIATMAFAGAADGWAQGIPMGTMKTKPDRTESKDVPSKDSQDKSSMPSYGPNQATAPGAPERVTPTYRDTTEDRIMRELTDDGAHDR